MYKHGKGISGDSYSSHLFTTFQNPTIKGSTALPEQLPAAACRVGLRRQGASWPALGRSQGCLGLLVRATKVLRLRACLGLVLLALRTLQPGVWQTCLQLLPGTKALHVQLQHRSLPQCAQKGEMPDSGLSTYVLPCMLHYRPSCTAEIEQLQMAHQRCADAAGCPGTDAEVNTLHHTSSMDACGSLAGLKSEKY